MESSVQHHQTQHPWQNRILSPVVWQQTNSLWPIATHSQSHWQWLILGIKWINIQFDHFGFSTLGNFNAENHSHSNNGLYKVKYIGLVVQSPNSPSGDLLSLECQHGSHHVALLVGWYQNTWLYSVIKSNFAGWCYSSSPYSALAICTIHQLHIQCELRQSIP